MKRTLSILLCIVMCFSVFGMTAAQAYAASSVNDYFEIRSTEFSNNKITYTLALAPNQSKITAFILKIKYDSSVLKISNETKKIGTLNESGDYVANVSGFYEMGNVVDLGAEEKAQYSIAYMHTSGFSIGEESKDFVKVVFEVAGEDHPYTDIEFYCQEYVTDDGNDDNDIKPGSEWQLIHSDNIFTLNKAVNMEVASTETGLKFSWVEADGAENYKIYRKPVDGEWELLTTVPAPANEYHDESISKGTEYYYTVASSNSHGDTPYDESGLIGMCFGTVTQISASMTEKGAKIEWNALDNANKYTVHRKTDDTDWIQVGETAETTYADDTLKSGVTYYYTVKAYHVSGKYVAETSVDPANVYYISAPDIANSLYKITENEIEVNWTVVAGATGYKVYRKTAEEAEYKWVADVEGNAYKDTDVSNGVTYSYKALSVAGDIESALSSESFEVKKLEIVSTPVAEMGRKSVKVSWAAVDGAQQYKIYRKANTGNWFPVITLDASVCEYTDTAVESGRDYVYAVSTLADGFITEKSNPSNSVCYLDSPDTSGIIAVINANSISLEWLPVNGAEKYRVYKKGVNAAEFEFVEEVTEPAYNDSAVADGEIYLYKIVSLGKGLESEMPEDAFTVTKIGVVKNVKAKLDVKKITVSWDAAKGAIGYKIYRQSPGLELTYIATVGSDATAYDDIAVSNGISYSYAIVSTDGTSETVNSEISNEVCYLDAPIVTGIENVDKGLQITFAAVTGASSYNVYRKTVDGTLEFVGSTTSKNTVYVDEGAVSGQKYIYGIAACYGETESPIFESEVACRLETPQLTLTSEYNGVKISWETVPGAENYVICHKIPGYPLDEVATVSGSKTSYIHTEAVDGARNHYTVYAVCGNSKSVVAESKFDFVKGPTIKSFTTTKSYVQLKWTATEYAEKYYIYRKTSASGAWTKIGTSTTTSYKDTKVSAGKTYYYTVAAENDYGDVSAKYAAGWTAKCLATPTLSKATNANGGVKFTWGKVTGATVYKVYRKAGSSKWTYIGESKTNSYTDKTAKSGTTYKYSVSAVNGKSASTYNTTGVSVKYVGAPQVKLANKADHISVSWAKITGATKYEVYRKAGSAKSWTKVATVKTNSYKDKNVKSGTTYKYMVKAYNGKIVSGFNSTGWSIKRLANPKLASAVSAKSGVTVKWNKVTGASGYEVYRKTGSGSFVKIATVKGGTKVSYLDKTAKKGKTYTYTVLAYSGSYKSAYNSGLKVTDKY